MQFFIIGSDQAFDAPIDATVGDLRNYTAQVMPVTVDELRLFAAGSPLVDDAMLLDSLTTVIITITYGNCSIPLRGKVYHDSLSRAGKVREQTPVVEPQEKKKKKTGRAKRRIQYNGRLNSNS